MGQISRFLRNGEDGRLSYWCQGCVIVHSVMTGEGSGPRWGYNGNPDAPTFTPSVLVQWDVSVPPVTRENLEEWRANPWVQHKEHRVCHTFVRDGMVEFLNDCTHEFAGQTVPLPELPEWLQDPKSVG